MEIRPCPSFSVLSLRLQTWLESSLKVAIDCSIWKNEEPHGCGVVLLPESDRPVYRHSIHQSQASKGRHLLPYIRLDHS
jgi:hypothetical protein